MLEKAFDSVVEGMAQLDTNRRVRLLEEIGRLHGMTITLFAILEGEGEGSKYPKEIVDGYMSAFNKDLQRSIAMTCAANGLELAPDPNKEVRDEILGEGNH